MDLKIEEKIRILTTQYTLNNKCLEIYIAGCKSPHCIGCCNPETWDFNQGCEWCEDIYIKMQKKIFEFSSLIDKIMIFGGELLDNPINEVIEFLKDLNTLKLPIWIFTKREIEDVPNEIKKLCSYIKCGRYEKNMIVENNIQYGIKLATSNQKIYKCSLFSLDNVQ